MAKIRKCPHCKSKRGYTYQYRIEGSGIESRNFKGDVIIDAPNERNVYDTVEIYTISCLNCNKKLDHNTVNTDK